MNDNFNIHRFGNILLSDLRGIAARKGISILIFGLVPAVIFIMKLIFTFGSYGMSNIDAGGRGFFFMAAATVFIIWMPSACYGHITDRKFGPYYTMVPASSIEKTLSMLLNMLIIVPAAFMIVYLSSDALITVMTGSPADESIAAMIFSGSESMSIPYQGSIADIFMVILNIFGYIMIFLAGAVWFRKNKIAKTILVNIGLGIIAMILITVIVKDDINMISDNPDMTANWLTSFFGNFRTVTLAYLSVLVTGLAAAVYFRVKKIQY